MEYIRVGNSTLAKLNFIAVRNIYNQDAIDEFLEYYNKEINRRDLDSRIKQQLKLWLARKKQGLKDYLRKNIKGDSTEFYRKVTRVLSLPHDAPDWLKEKAEENPKFFQEEEIYKVKDPLKSDLEFRGKVDHILDYLIYYLKENTSKNLKNMTWVHVKKGIKKWEEAFKKDESNKPLPGEKRVVVSEGGYFWVELTDKASLENEGSRMDHCVGGYCDQVESGNTTIYSLRDPKNIPHLTVELDLIGYDDSYAEEYEDDYHEVYHDPSIVQISGKANSSPKFKYKEQFLDLLSSLEEKFGDEVKIADGVGDSLGLLSSRTGYIIDIEENIVDEDGDARPASEVSQEELLRIIRTTDFGLGINHIKNMDDVEIMLKDRPEMVRGILVNRKTMITEALRRDLDLLLYMSKKQIELPEVSSLAKELILKTKSFQLIDQLPIEAVRDKRFVLDVYQEDSELFTASSYIPAEVYFQFFTDIYGEFPEYFMDKEFLGSFFDKYEENTFDRMIDTVEFKRLLNKNFEGVIESMRTSIKSLVLNKEWVADIFFKKLSNADEVEFQRLINNPATEVVIDKSRELVEGRIRDNPEYLMKYHGIYLSGLITVLSKIIHDMSYSGKLDDTVIEGYVSGELNMELLDPSLFIKQVLEVPEVRDMVVNRAVLDTHYFKKISYYEPFKELFGNPEVINSIVEQLFEGQSLVSLGQVIQVMNDKLSSAILASSGFKKRLSELDDTGPFDESVEVICLFLNRPPYIKFYNLFLIKLISKDLNSNLPLVVGKPEVLEALEEEGYLEKLILAYTGKASYIMSLAVERPLLFKDAKLQEHLIDLLERDTVQSRSFYPGTLKYNQILEILLKNPRAKNLFDTTSTEIPSS